MVWNDVRTDRVAGVEVRRHGHATEQRVAVAVLPARLDQIAAHAVRMIGTDDTHRSDLNGQEPLREPGVQSGSCWGAWWSTSPGWQSGCLSRGVIAPRLRSSWHRFRSEMVALAGGPAPSRRRALRATGIPGRAGGIERRRPFVTSSGRSPSG